MCDTTTQFFLNNGMAVFVLAVVQVELSDSPSFESLGSAADPTVGRAARLCLSILSHLFINYHTFLAALG